MSRASDRSVVSKGLKSSVGFKSKAGTSLKEGLGGALRGKLA